MKTIPKEKIRFRIGYFLDKIITGKSIIYFASIGLSDINTRLVHSALIGNIKLVKYYVSKGANNLNSALSVSYSEGHKNIIHRS